MSGVLAELRDVDLTKNNYYLAVITPSHIPGKKKWTIINPGGNTLAYCLEHKELLEKCITSTHIQRDYDNYGLAYRHGWQQLNKAFQQYYGIKTTARNKAKSKKRKRR